MQIPVKLFEKVDSFGNRYLVGAPTNWPVDIKLSDVFFLVYPDQEDPQILIKSSNRKKQQKENEKEE